MSDAISLLIGPNRQDAPDLESFRNGVAYACLAWNMTLMPEEERGQTLGRLNSLTPDLESRVDMLAILSDLMERKNLLFPDVDRMILEWKVTEQGRDFHISIASTLGKPPQISISNGFKRGQENAVP